MPLRWHWTVNAMLCHGKLGHLTPPDARRLIFNRFSGLLVAAARSGIVTTVAPCPNCGHVVTAGCGDALSKYVQDTMPRGSPGVHLSRYW